MTHQCAAGHRREFAGNGSPDLEIALAESSKRIADSKIRQ
jgi:hypothetical protein